MWKCSIYKALKKIAWFIKVGVILGVLAFYRIDYKCFMSKIVLNDSEMKMTESNDF